MAIDRENLIEVETQHRNNWKVVLIAVGIGILCVSVITYGFMTTLNLKGTKAYEEEFEATTTEPRVEDEFGHHERHTEPQCVPIEFGYLILAVRWPIGACEDLKCIPKLPNEWKIHGLWPNYDNGSWPQFCCDRDKFDVSQVESLRPRLEANWLNLLAHKDSTGLWAHEWDKHGTCSVKNPQIKGEYNYFNTSLTLFDNLKVSQWLKEAGITPGKETTGEAVKAALKPHFGKKVSVHCVKEHKSPNARPDLKGYTVLESVHFCHHKTKITPIDCPDADSCPTTFLYPSEGQ